jgi:hypothetical protein
MSNYGPATQLAAVDAYNMSFSQGPRLHSSHARIWVQVRSLLGCTVSQWRAQSSLNLDLISLAYYVLRHEYGFSSISMAVLAKVGDHACRCCPSSYDSDCDLTSIVFLCLHTSASISNMWQARSVRKSRGPSLIRRHLIRE